MTRSVDEIDEIVIHGVGLRVLVGNDHGCGSGVDRDSPGGFLLVVIEEALLSGGLGGHHSGSCDQVVRECGLSVVDMRSSSEIPDVGLILHQLDCFLGIVFSSAHFHNLRIIWRTARPSPSPPSSQRRRK